MIRKVLDHGEVELIQACGDDYTPVQAARTSYASHSDDGERDARLLRYLASHGHYGPFEFVDVTFRVKAPLFVARQWMRHRTGSYNEFSFRYAEPSRISKGEDIEYYSPVFWRSQDTADRQGSVTSTELDFSMDFDRGMHDAIGAYHSAIERGVSREQARMLLPTSVYTTFWYKSNMRNLLHFLHLRLDEHAQWETRQYAEAVAEDVKENWPQIWGLFEEGHFV
jgi:thymidylate synthase (FAD)